MISELKSITRGLGSELISNSATNKKYTFLVSNSDCVIDSLTGTEDTNIKND